MKKVLFVLMVLGLAFTSAAAAQEDTGPTRGALWTQDVTATLATAQLDVQQWMIPLGHAGIGLTLNEFGDNGLQFGAQLLGEIGILDDETVASVAEASDEAAFLLSLGWALGRELPAFLGAEDVIDADGNVLVTAGAIRLDSGLDFGEHMLYPIVKLCHDKFGVAGAVACGVGFAALDYYTVGSRDLRQ